MLIILRTKTGLSSFHQLQIARKQLLSKVILRKIAMFEGMLKVTFSATIAQWRN